jgi:hypothetical protein
MVFELYTKEMYDSMQQWMEGHDLLDLEYKTSKYQEVVLT